VTALSRDRRISVSFASVSGALLLLGVAYYLCFRSVLPPMLVPFRSGPPAFESVAWLGWFPSLIHVSAFGLLSCAFLRPGLASALAAGATWAGVNLLWELSCRDQQAWLRVGVEQVGVRRVPACTYDAADIAASLAGAVAAVGIAWLILRLHGVRHPAFREQRA